MAALHSVGDPMAAGLIFAGSAGPYVLGDLLARHRRAVEEELERLVAERARGEREGYLRPEVSPWLLYVTAVLEASRLAVDIPARSALIATVVPAADLHSAQSLSSTVFGASALVGPAVGGLLLATAGPS